MLAFSTSPRTQLFSNNNCGGSSATNKARPLSHSGPGCASCLDLSGTPVSGGASVSHPFPGSPYRVLPWPQAKPSFGSGLFSSLCFPWLLLPRGLVKTPFLFLLNILLLANQEMRYLTRVQTWLVSALSFWVFFPLVALICHPTDTPGIYFRGQLLEQDRPYSRYAD